MSRDPKNPGPHGACDDCRTVPCECPPEPTLEPEKRISARRIGSPRSVTFTDAQLDWLKAHVRPGGTFTDAVRECVQAIMDGAVQPCHTKHCHKRRML